MIVLQCLQVLRTHCLSYSKKHSHSDPFCLGKLAAQTTHRKMKASSSPVRNVIGPCIPAAFLLTQTQDPTWANPGSNITVSCGILVFSYFMKMDSLKGQVTQVAFTQVQLVVAFACVCNIDDIQNHFHSLLLQQRNKPHHTKKLYMVTLSFILNIGCLSN